MRAAVVTALLFLVVLIAGCSASYTLEFEGVVIDESTQQPFDNGTVKIFENGHEIWTTKTDENGRWKFSQQLSGSDVMPGGKNKLTLRTGPTRTIRIFKDDEAFNVSYPLITIPDQSGSIVPVNIRTSIHPKKYRP